MLLATFVWEEGGGRGWTVRASIVIFVYVCHTKCLLFVTLQAPVNTVRFWIQSVLLLLTRGFLFSTTPGSEPIHFTLATMADPDEGEQSALTAQNLMSVCLAGCADDSRPAGHAGAFIWCLRGSFDGCAPTVAYSCTYRWLKMQWGDSPTDGSKWDWDASMLSDTEDKPTRVAAVKCLCSPLTSVAQRFTFTQIHIHYQSFSTLWHTTVFKQLITIAINTDYWVLSSNYPHWFQSLCTLGQWCAAAA